LKTLLVVDGVSIERDQLHSIDLLPVGKLTLALRWNVKGATAGKGDVPVDFEGEVELAIDAHGLAALVRDAITQRGRRAKAGPATVRFRGVCGLRPTAADHASSKGERA
jgi:hypothetical protein